MPFAVLALFPGFRGLRNDVCVFSGQECSAWYTGGNEGVPTHAGVSPAYPPIYSGEAVEVHQFNPMPVYEMPMPSGKPLYSPAAGAGFIDPSMQTFQQNFGSGLGFYDGCEGMPQGYYEALRALPDVSCTRRAVRKQVFPDAESHSTQPSEVPKRHRRRILGCCWA